MTRKRPAKLGSLVRARLAGWDEIQAKNRSEFPDPGLPTYEGMPEWVEGALSVRHVHAPWGKFRTYSVSTEDGRTFDIDEATIEPAHSAAQKPARAKTKRPVSANKGSPD